MIEVRQRYTNLLFPIALIFFIPVLFLLNISLDVKLGIVIFVSLSMLLSLLMFKDISKGILVWLLVMVLFGQENIVQFENLPNFPFERFIWCFITIIFIIHVVSKGIKLISFSTIEFVMTVFISLCIISMLHNGVFFIKGAGSRSFFNGFFVPYLTFVIAKNVFDCEKKIIHLLYLLFFLGIYLTVTGLLERYEMYSFIPHYYFVDRESGTHLDRLMGPFGNAAVFGTIVVMLFHSSYYLYEQVSGTKKRMIQIFIFIMPIVIFFSYTRAVWLSFCLTLFVVLLLNPRSRRNLLVILVCLSTLIILRLPSILSADRSRGGVLEEAPVETRLALYETYYNMFLAKPILGHGFGEITYHDVQLNTGEEVSSHDSFMSILVEQGVVGLTLVILIYSLLLAKSIRFYKRLNRDCDALWKGFVIIYWAMAGTYFINSLFIEIRHFLLANSLFFVLSGIVVGGYQRKCFGKEKVSNNTRLA
jgi:O-antigen ligase